MMYLGNYMEMDFKREKTPEELPLPPQRPDKGYFPQLLKVLSGSWDRFENYHAVVAMWSMSHSLDTGQMRELCDRVLDGSLGYTFEKVKWDRFVEYLRKRRQSLGS